LVAVEITVVVETDLPPTPPTAMAAPKPPRIRATASTAIISPLIREVSDFKSLILFVRT